MRIDTTADIEIDLDIEEVAAHVCDSRTFTDAVRSVVEDMDLQTPVEQAIDYLDVPSKDDVSDIAREEVRDYVRTEGFMAEDDVDDLVRSILHDEGLLRDSQVGIAAQARIEALEAQVATLQQSVRYVAEVLKGAGVTLAAIAAPQE